MRYQQGRMASFVFISVKTQTTEKIRFNVNLVSKTTDRLLVYRRKILPIFDKRNQSLALDLCSTSIFMLWVYLNADTQMESFSSYLLDS